jgi:HPt (histidine-containing phosphotransfer) domain-containing protein
MNAIDMQADPSLATLLPFDGDPPSAASTRADAMARFENDGAFLQRIVPLFREAAIEQSRALIDAADAGDARRIQHWAHTLKGSLLTVGAGPVAGRAEHIETAAREQRVDGLAPLCRRLAAETLVIADQLSATSR